MDVLGTVCNTLRYRGEQDVICTLENLLVVSMERKIKKKMTDFVFKGVFSLIGCM